MILDSSALLAILLLEPEAERFINAVLDADRRGISAASYVEAGLAIDSRSEPATRKLLDDAITALGLEIVPLDAAQARIAREAHLRFGRGRHPAALDFGDCFAYALAKATGEPLLFKGNAFAQTDITPAV